MRYVCVRRLRRVNIHDCIVTLYRINGFDRFACRSGHLSLSVINSTLFLALVVTSRVQRPTTLFPVYMFPLRYLSTRHH